MYMCIYQYVYVFMYIYIYLDNGASHLIGQGTFHEFFHEFMSSTGVLSELYRSNVTSPVSACKWALWIHAMALF